MASLFFSSLRREELSGSYPGKDIQCGGLCTSVCGRGSSGCNAEWLYFLHTLYERQSPLKAVLVLKPDLNTAVLTDFYPVNQSDRYMPRQFCQILMLLKLFDAKREMQQPSCKRGTAGAVRAPCAEAAYGPDGGYGPCPCIHRHPPVPSGRGGESGSAAYEEAGGGHPGIL